MSSPRAATFIESPHPVVPRSQKVHSAFTRLREMAYRRGPGAQLPTFKELCAELGVSKVTLDAALADLEQGQVLYRKHGVGIFVCAELKQSIAVICDPRFLQHASMQEYWRLLVKEAQARVEAQGEALSFHFSTLAGPQAAPLHEDLMKSIEGGRIAGAIGMGLDGPATEWILGKGLPFVSYASYAPHMVAHSNESVLRLGVESLAAQGCRRIELWGWSTVGEAQVQGSYGDNEQRKIRGFLEAHGLHFHLELVRGVRATKSDGAPMSHFEQGYELACEVFKQSRINWPDGILIGNDVMTQGGMLALQTLGVEVPGEVLIATHANRGSWVLHGYEERLTLLEFDPGEIVNALFDVLESCMRGEMRPEGTIYAEPHLRIGKMAMPKSM